MKITIAPSQDQTKEEVPLYAITVEDPNDELPIKQVVDIVFQALQGWGYSSDGVHKAFNDFTR